MTFIWRIVEDTPEAKAFDGEGSRITGGRWNHKGIAVVYASESIALSALEKFVNFGQRGKYLKFALTKAEIPLNIIIDVKEIKDLPPDWRKYPPPRSTQDLGTAWVKEGASAVLKIPSVIVPEEFNYILNVSHPDFKMIKTYDPVSFSFDSRMWEASGKGVHRWTR